MNFKFKFLNFHISHLTQLGMINITLKCHKKKYVKQFIIFTTIWNGFWLLSLYLHPLGPRFTLFVNVNIKHEMCKYNFKSKYVYMVYAVV
jgi:hypothetical protein